MQNKALVYLTASPSWVVWDSQKNKIADVYQGDPALMQEALQNASVTVLVPAEDVVITQTKLPKLSLSKLYQALPYALEEQLVEEVDRYHFAILDQTDETVTVAIVSTEKMTNWLSQLRLYQIEPARLLPISLVLPFTENTWTIVVETLALLRLNRFQTIACDLDNLAAVLQMAMAVETPEKLSIQLFNDQIVLPTIPFAKEVHQYRAQELLSYLAENGDYNHSYTLLQKDFAIKTARMPKTKRIWQIAGALFAIWFLFLFIYPTITYFMLQPKLAQLDTDIHAIYKRHFPNATSMVAPKIRMQEKIKKLSGESGEKQLFVLLAKIGKEMNEAMKINRIDFQNKQLTLDVSAVSSETFETFCEALNKTGLIVKQQSANMTSDKMNATLVIE